MNETIIYVGFYVHKDTIAVALADGGERGDVRAFGQITNTPAALSRLLTKLVQPGRAFVGLNDHFDGNALDTAEWTTQEILSRQMEFITPGRCGGSAIDVVVREGDNGDECEDDCQRAELRTAKSTWPRFGDEVWYRFSFRISGDVPSTGSARSVIGQWKGPGDGSPMIAQRFDNGVFYITVQDNQVRRVVAKAEGDPDALVAAQDGLGRLYRTDEKTIDGIRSLQSLDLLSRTQPRVAQEYFKPDLLVTLASRAPASQSEKLSTSLGLADRDIVSRFYALCFIAEPDKYLGKASIAIEPVENRPCRTPAKDGSISSTASNPVGPTTSMVHETPAKSTSGRMALRLFPSVETLERRSGGAHHCP